MFKNKKIIQILSCTLLSAFLFTTLSTPYAYSQGSSSSRKEGVPPRLSHTGRAGEEAGEKGISPLQRRTKGGFLAFSQLKHQYLQNLDKLKVSNDEALVKQINIIKDIIENRLLFAAPLERSGKQYVFGAYCGDQSRVHFVIEYVEKTDSVQNYSREGDSFRENVKAAVGTLRGSPLCSSPEGLVTGITNALAQVIVGSNQVIRQVLTDQEINKAITGIFAKAEGESLGLAKLEDVIPSSLAVEEYQDRVNLKSNQQFEEATQSFQKQKHVQEASLLIDDSKKTQLSKQNVNLNNNNVPFGLLPIWQIDSWSECMVAILVENIVFSFILAFLLPFLIHEYTGYNLVLLTLYCVVFSSILFMVLHTKVYHNLQQPPQRPTMADRGKLLALGFYMNAIAVFAAIWFALAFPIVGDVYFGIGGGISFILTIFLPMVIHFLWTWLVHRSSISTTPNPLVIQMSNNVTSGNDKQSKLKELFSDEQSEALSPDLKSVLMKENNLALLLEAKTWLIEEYGKETFEKNWTYFAALLEGMASGTISSVQNAYLTLRDIIEISSKGGFSVSGTVPKGVVFNYVMAGIAEIVKQKELKSPELIENPKLLWLEILLAAIDFKGMLNKKQLLELFAAVYPEINAAFGEHWIRDNFFVLSKLVEYVGIVNAYHLFKTDLPELMRSDTPDQFQQYWSYIYSIIEKADTGGIQSNYNFIKDLLQGLTEKNLTLFIPTVNTHLSQHNNNNNAFGLVELLVEIQMLEFSDFLNTIPEVAMTDTHLFQHSNNNNNIVQLPDEVSKADESLDEEDIPLDRKSNKKEGPGLVRFWEALGEKEPGLKIYDLAGMLALAETFGLALMKQELQKLFEVSPKLATVEKAAEIFKGNVQGMISEPEKFIELLKHGLPMPEPVSDIVMKAASQAFAEVHGNSFYDFNAHAFVPVPDSAQQSFREKMRALGQKMVEADSNHGIGEAIKAHAKHNLSVQASHASGVATHLSAKSMPDMVKRHLALRSEEEWKKLNKTEQNQVVNAVSSRWKNIKIRVKGSKPIGMGVDLLLQSGEMALGFSAREGFYVELSGGALLTLSGIHKDQESLRKELEEALEKKISLIQWDVNTLTEIPGLEDAMDVMIGRIQSVALDIWESLSGERLSTSETMQLNQKIGSILKESLSIMRKNAVVVDLRNNNKDVQARLKLAVEEYRAYRVNFPEDQVILVLIGEDAVIKEFKLQTGISDRELFTTGTEPGDVMLALTGYVVKVVTGKTEGWPETVLLKYLSDAIPLKTWKDLQTESESIREFLIQA